jgi:hypothetical protein
VHRRYAGAGEAAAERIDSARGSGLEIFSRACLNSRKSAKRKRTQKHNHRALFRGRIVYLQGIGKMELILFN